MKVISAHRAEITFLAKCDRLLLHMISQNVILARCAEINVYSTLHPLEHHMIRVQVHFDVIKSHTLNKMAQNVMHGIPS